MRAFARRHDAAPAAVILPAEHAPPDDRALIDAYRYLQITVGIIAVLLPIVTVAGRGSPTVKTCRERSAPTTTAGWAPTSSGACVSSA